MEDALSPQTTPIPDNLIESLFCGKDDDGGIPFKEVHGSCLKTSQNNFRSPVLLLFDLRDFTCDPIFQNYWSFKTMYICSNSSVVCTE